MTSSSQSTGCKHPERRKLRKVTIVQKRNKLSTGVRIAGGKDFILVPVKDPTTRRYNWLIYCVDCLEILEGEPYVP